MPVLWDKEQATIVNNESADIIRIFSSAFNQFLPPKYSKIDLYPTAFRKEIDDTNAWVYEMLNCKDDIRFLPSFLFISWSIAGVYKAAFAGSQSEYDSACQKVFEALDRVEKILSKQEFLVGDQLTEADVRLWTTAVSVILLAL